MTKVDIFIAGGGPAGLVAAAVFAAAGRTVALADPTPDMSPGTDFRTTAVLLPGQTLLEQAGLWAHLAPVATPLAALRVMDTIGWPPEIREDRLFRASDVGADAFGWNLPNATIRAVARDALQSMPEAHLSLGRRVVRHLARDRSVRIWLDDGTVFESRLLIGADGRASGVRGGAGILVETKRYGQKALAFRVSHPHGHDNISTEIYNTGGAFTLVPLPSEDGRPTSAVVWMEDGRRALDLIQMAPEALAREMTMRSMDVLGPLALETDRHIWPIVTQTATSITARRVALMAEAAHVMPPIGAQGLNTSLADVSALRDAMQGAEDPGAEEVLSRYARARRKDVALRASAIDLFNQIARSSLPPVQALRRAGLAAVHGIAPLRLAAMRAGLGRSPRA